MPNETTTRTVVTAPDGTVTETVVDAVNSVEIGETAKGLLRIESVKVYDADPAKAATRALATYGELKKTIQSRNTEGLY